MYVLASMSQNQRLNCKVHQDLRLMKFETRLPDWEHLINSDGNEECGISKTCINFANPFYTVTNVTIPKSA